MDEAAQASDAPKFEIQLSRDGSSQLDGANLSEDEIFRKLELAQQANPHLQALLRADRDLPMERITKWLDKLSDRGIAKVAITATQLAETPPILRQLNWQDQVKAGTGEAWMPSGEISNSEGWMPPIVGMDISGKKVGEQDPRFLCLWFSHPLIDRHSVSSVPCFKKTGNGSWSPQCGPCDESDTEIGE